MAPTVQRWRKYATGLMLIVWLLAASVVGSRWHDIEWLESVLFIVGCLLMGVGVIGRIWCLACIAGCKNEELITDGPYSLCRNPLYLFSLVGTIGVGLGSCTISFPVLAVVGFAIWYPRTIHFESNTLAQRHGKAYEAYRQKTPALVPAYKGFHEAEHHTVRSSSFRRGAFDTIWFFATFAIMHVFFEMHDSGLLPTWYEWP